MTDERFWLLISLQLSREATQGEMAELESYLLEHPEKRIKKDRIAAIWLANAQSQPDRKADAFNKHMQRLSNHLSEPALKYQSERSAETFPDTKKKRPLLVKVLTWITAIALSSLVIWLVLIDMPAPSEAVDSKAQNTVSTKRGSKSNIQLPDGTDVWLNADSKITYNESFKDDIREVNLSGEAFFEVVKDKKRPFIIHTDVIDIKVLGTAFNVRSYMDEENTETSLIRGSVEIMLRNSPDKKFTLRPDDKLIVRNNQVQVGAGETVRDDTESKQILLTWEKIKYQKSDSSATETLWIKNKLVFDEESLEKIALKIERWYDVKLIITDDRIKKTKYTTVFDDESLSQVMEALQHTGKFRYTINKKEVTIRP